MKLPEDPRPVPAGMSAMLVISMLGPATPVRRSASRMMGWRISGTVLTRSICEYRSTISCSGVRWIVVYTYCVMAADTRNPPWSR